MPYWAEPSHLCALCIFQREAIMWGWWLLCIRLCFDLTHHNVDRFRLFSVSQWKESLFSVAQGRGHSRAIGSSNNITASTFKKKQFNWSWTLSFLSLKVVTDKRLLRWLRIDDEKWKSRELISKYCISSQTVLLIHSHSQIERFILIHTLCSSITSGCLPWEGTVWAQAL